LEDPDGLVLCCASSLHEDSEERDITMQCQMKIIDETDTNVF